MGVVITWAGLCAAGVHAHKILPQREDLAQRPAELPYQRTRLIALAQLRYLHRDRGARGQQPGETREQATGVREIDLWAVVVGSRPETPVGRTGEQQLESIGSSDPSTANHERQRPVHPRVIHKLLGGFSPLPIRHYARQKLHRHSRPPAHPGNPKRPAKA